MPLPLPLPLSLSCKFNVICHRFPGFKTFWFALILSWNVLSSHILPCTNKSYYFYPVGTDEFMNCEGSFQWWTGLPGHREKSRWAGPPEWVTFWPPGPLVHYYKLTKFRNA